MHAEDHEIICPNCGSHAKGNYCYQCGQQNHLHKDTFWGLIFHFIEHYIHYDSKFWQTLKALWFSPGKLTIAYLNKQRMRYLPPISLYIFVSFVYFLLSASFRPSFSVNEHPNGVITIHSGKSGVHSIRNVMDSMDTKTVATTPDSVLDPISSYINTRSEAIKKKHGDFDRFIKENLEHTLPKIFFFMIPVMAAILKLLFIRRKDAYFVDHAIFSLHYHSFWFSLFLFSIIPMSAKVQSILMPVLLLIAAIYLVLSMKRVYRIGTFRSIANMFIISILYTIGIILAFTGDFLLIMCTA